jgi:sugar O-acyltransferase (sialic acid O-acetyltransferase NeuD family)
VKNLLLIGGGGHCRSCIDVIEAEAVYGVIGIVESADHGGQGEVLGYPVVGTDEDLPKLLGDEVEVMVTLGQIKTPEPRRRLVQRLKSLGARFATCVSPLARVSPHARLGEGTMVMHGALVNAGAEVGEHCILNSASLVEHDALLLDFVHLSTGAIVNGGVKVGSGTFLGSKTTTREYIEIGCDNVICAGSVVLGALPDRTKASSRVVGR